MVALIDLNRLLTFSKHRLPHRKLILLWISRSQFLLSNPHLTMADHLPRRRIVLSNLPLEPSGSATQTEPAVEVLTEQLQTEEMFEGLLRKTPVGTVTAVPTNFDGS